MHNVVCSDKFKMGEDPMIPLGHFFNYSYTTCECTYVYIQILLAIKHCAQIVKMEIDNQLIACRPNENI